MEGWICAYKSRGRGGIGLMGVTLSPNEVALRTLKRTVTESLIDDQSLRSIVHVIKSRLGLRIGPFNAHWDQAAGPLSTPFHI